MLRATWLLCCVVLVLSTVSVITADDTDGNRTAAKFVKEQMAGKTIVGAETTERLDSGKVDSVSSSRIQFRNFKETKSGFCFDAETTIHQVLYDLNADGKRIEPGQSKNRSFILRYQVGQRLSTKEYIGVALPVNKEGVVGAENDDYPFSPSSVQIRMEGEKLILTATTILYQDLFAKGGKWRPGVEEDSSVFSVHDGKLQRSLKIKGYDVDPRTLERKLSDDLPEEIQKQVDVVAREK